MQLSPNKMQIAEQVGIADSLEIQSTAGSRVNVPVIFRLLVFDSCLRRRKSC
jgi:hypothetical protein